MFTEAHSTERVEGSFPFTSSLHSHRSKSLICAVCGNHKRDTGSLMPAKVYRQKAMAGATQVSKVRVDNQGAVGVARMSELSIGQAEVNLRGVVLEGRPAKAGILQQENTVMCISQGNPNWGWGGVVPQETGQRCIDL